MMKAYIYLNWDKFTNEATLSLKRAMIQEISENIFQLGQNGFLFFTNKKDELVKSSIKEKKNSKFLLIDVTNGINNGIINTNINLKEMFDGIPVKNIKMKWTLPSNIEMYQSEEAEAELTTLILNEINSKFELNDILDKISKNGYESLTREEEMFLDYKSRNME